MIKVKNQDWSALKELGSDQTQIDISINRIRNVLGETFHVDDNVLSQICSALKSNQHVILCGPPGTGKTTIAQAIACAANNKDPLITTATSDWSTFDTVGGYMPNISKSDAELSFEPGIILKSIIEKNWIIVDEINRAPIDKAIGQLFTILSGGEIVLPYKEEVSGNRIQITSSLDRITRENHIYKSPSWRLIATMNEYDKNSLFEMSYAFMRRFAFIRIGIPETMETLLNSWCDDSNIQDEVKEVLLNISKASTKNVFREIGPAIFQTMIEYMKNRYDYDQDHILHFAESVSMFLLPQFQGFEDQEIKSLWNIISKLIENNEKGKSLIDSGLQLFTGYTLLEIIQVGE